MAALVLHKSIQMTAVAVESLPTEPRARKLRLWPGVLLTVTFWLLSEGLKQFYPGTPAQVNVLFFGPHVLAALVLVWWLWLSGLSWREKLIPLGVLVVGGIVTVLVAHKSMPFMLMLFGLPMAWTVMSFAAFLFARASGSTRTTVICVALACVGIYHSLLRLEGTTGSLDADHSWRWTPTSEEKFLASQPKPAQPVTDPDEVSSAPTLALGPNDWPGFRGPERNSRVYGVKIATDWKQHPPKQLWKQRIGPGWSSFAVVGDYLFTQEQRGENESVVCYRANSGDQVWAHNDNARFEEIVAGAGPRATPTFDEGRIYALGARGILNCLDAATGKRLWSSDIVSDTGAKVPTWGFSSSPLVVAGRAIVYAGAKEKSLLGYNALTGKLEWTIATGELSYSSPQRAKLGDEEYVLMATEEGILAVTPGDGQLAWQHEWKSPQVARVAQPQFISDTQFVIGSGDGIGTRLVSLSPSADSWQTTESWSTLQFQPDFNDYVYHDGYLYGFDGHIFACVDAATGKRVWKKGRYGHGQVLLVANQGVLLVLSESGELVLLEANPQKHVELAKHAAIEGKTWNHPVLVGNRLFVRNGEEVAALELKTK